MDEVREVRTAHLVKGEDLNHHQTLYAGRCIEWSTHAAYITAQSCFAVGQPLVFMSIRSLSMRSPARLGEVVEFIGRVDYIGESTIGVRVDARKMQPKDDPKPVVTGTFLFCAVDEEGKAMPHGLPSISGQTRGAEKRWKAAEESFAASMT
jgi:acyl-CoA hydrolase